MAIILRVSQVVLDNYYQYVNVAHKLNEIASGKVKPISKNLRASWIYFNKVNIETELSSFETWFFFPQ